jgi:hypothetical protein
MPASKTEKKPKKSKPESTSKGATLDVVFGGPLLFVPTVRDGNVTDVEVFSPHNGHPMGAVFLPAVRFTDAELNNPQGERWPEPVSFSLLDPHSYAIHLSQKSKKPNPFRVTEIPETNHKVKPGRRLSADWEVAIQLNGQISAWTSHHLVDMKDEFFGGSDAPASKQVARVHRLTYLGVTAAEFCGCSKESREYLRANISKGGTLIILGEIPYQSTLLHERQAVSALAKLAGLDLHLLITAPAASSGRLMDHITNPCAHSIILA